MKKRTKKKVVAKGAGKKDPLLPSLAGIKFEDALRGLLQTKPPKKSRN